MIDLEHLEGYKLRKGKYQLDKRQSTTRMSVLYRATDTDNKRTVAVKILKDEKYKERFTNEANLGWGIPHSNIAATIDYEPRGESINNEISVRYIVMKWLDGISLKDYIEDPREKSTQEVLAKAVTVLQRIGPAVEFLHQKHILHRDIKPSNIHWDGDEPNLIDFGIAKRIVDPTSTEIDDAPVTHEDQLPGTYRYMSPEQARGDKFLTGASDQYSLALTIYDIISNGVSPYSQALDGTINTRATKTVSTNQRYIWEQTHNEVPPLPIYRQKNRGDVPVAVSNVLEKALAKEPTERYETVQAFADAFKNAVEAKPTRTIKMPTMPTVAMEKKPTRPSVMLIGLMVIIVTLAVALFVLLQAPSTPATAEGSPTALQSGPPTDAAVVSRPTASDEPPTATLVPSPLSGEDRAATIQARMEANVTETLNAISVETKIALMVQANLSTAAAAQWTKMPTETETLPPTLTPVEAVILPTSTATEKPSLTPAEPTITPVPTDTEAPTITPMPTDTDSPTVTPVPTDTDSPTQTSTDTDEPTATNTPTPSPTLLPTVTNTPTSTSSSTPSPTITPSDTASPTLTPTTTDTPTATLIPSATSIGGGELLMFSSAHPSDPNRDIYTYNLRSGDIDPIITGPRYDIQGVWSPDGSRIAFISDRDEPVPAPGKQPIYQLYLADSDGQNKNVIALTTPDSFPMGMARPAWSPDGQTIIFQADVEGVGTQLFQVRIGGSHDLSRFQTAGPSRRPMFSPDGNFIYFFMFSPSGKPDETIPNGSSDIMKIDMRQVPFISVSLTNDAMTSADAPRIENSRPNVSPDGSQIAFYSTHYVDLDSSNSQIVVVGTDGSNEHPVTSGETRNDVPIWSPDGTKLVYTATSKVDKSTLYSIQMIEPSLGPLSTPTTIFSQLYFLECTDWRSFVSIG